MLKEEGSECGSLGNTREEERWPESDIKKGVGSGVGELLSDSASRKGNRQSHKLKVAGSAGSQHTTHSLLGQEHLILT